MVLYFAVPLWGKERSVPMEKEENEHVEEESKLEEIADELVEALEINAWTYVNSGAFID